MAAEILACRRHADNGNLAVRPVDLVMRDKMRMAVKNQLCTVFAYDLLETANTIEAFMGRRCTIDRRVMDHHNTEEPTCTGFIQHCGQTFSLFRPEVAARHERGRRTR
jgi:hypothetical protein